MIPELPDDRDVGLIFLESLIWANERDDIVAAARLLAYREPDHTTIGVFDCYLLSDGTVEKWQDHSDDRWIVDYQTPHPDWDKVLDEYFRVALAASVAR